MAEIQQKSKLRKVPKTFWWTAFGIVAILAISILGTQFANVPKIIPNSEINIGSDLLSEALEVELTRNDSIVKLTNQNQFGKYFVFASTNSDYVLKISLQGKILASEKFSISANKPKFIYVWFENANTNFQKYSDSIYRMRLKQEIKGKKVAKQDFRNLATEIKRAITLEDLAKIGYRIEDEKIGILVRDGSPLPRL